QPHTEIALAEDFHRSGLAAQHAGRLELLGADRAASGKITQVAHVDFAEGHAERIAKASPIRQLADERQLTALEVRRNPAARARVLALGALATRLDFATPMPAADAHPLAGRTLRRVQVIELHI